MLLTRNALILGGQGHIIYEFFSMTVFMNKLFDTKQKNGHVQVSFFKRQPVFNQQITHTVHEKSINIFT